MAQHRSLRSRSRRRRHRNVLKRHERIRILSAGGRWKDGESVYGLPKVRSIKERVRKAKATAVVAGTKAQAGAEAAKPPETESAGQ